MGTWMWTPPHTASKELSLVLLNYGSRWKLLKGSGVSFLQIRVLLYKAMQMRSGLNNLSVIPVAYIKWEHDTVFSLGSEEEKMWWIALRKLRRGGVKTKQCSALAFFEWHELHLASPASWLSWAVASLFAAIQTQASLIKENKDFCPILRTFESLTYVWILQHLICKPCNYIMYRSSL